MAKISFDSVSTVSENQGSTSNVRYFSLKNDGDEAIVRIMQDDVSSFDIHTVHDIVVDNKHRKVECIREPHQTVDACPFCEAEEKLQQRIYVKMIQYVVENGQIIPQAVVWERPASTFARKLKSLMDEYGPLSDYIFKIKRNGAAGSKDTTYELMLAHPNQYPIDRYPKVDLFGDYNPLGHAILNKSAEEMIQFLNTGVFTTSYTTPAPVNNIPASPQRYTSAPRVSTYTPPAAPLTTATAPQSVDTYNEVPKADNTSNNNSAPVGRPTRYY